MRPFTQHGMLAVKADALAIAYDQSAACVYRMVGDVALLEIRGPLEHHAGWFANYDGIKAAMGEALAGPAKAVLMSIDSPGGVVSGCADTALELRAMADAAGKPVYAYVDGTTASAAYMGLACMADRVFVPPTGEVGHLGVIRCRVDASAAEEAMGVKTTFVVSGKYKAIGQPSSPLTEVELTELQSIVDETAGILLGNAARFRGKTVEDFLALEARVFIGQSAVSVGIADEVATLDQVLAAISAGSVGAVEAPKGSQMDKEEAIKALRAAAEDGDEEAKAMVAALGGDEDKAEAPEEEKAEEEEEEEAPKKEEAKAMKASMQALRAELEEIKRAAAVAPMLASRPDLSPELRKLLKSESPAKVSAFLAATPVAPQGNSAASLAAVKASGHSPASVSPDAATRSMDPMVAKAFGDGQVKLGVSRDGINVKLWAVQKGDK